MNNQFICWTNSKWALGSSIIIRYILLSRNNHDIWYIFYDLSFYMSIYIYAWACVCVSVCIYIDDWARKYIYIFKQEFSVVWRIFVLILLPDCPKWFSKKYFHRIT